MSEKKKKGRPLKKMDITIPETLDEILLGQFQRFHKATDGEKDVDTVNKLALNIFFGIPIKDFERVKARDVHTLVAMLNKALTTPPKLKMRFEMNGVEYGFIPNLNDISFGELINLDANAGMDKLHLVMRILFRRIVDSNDKGMYKIASYNNDPTDEEVLIMKDMPTGVALSAVNFIMTLGIQLTATTLKSSMSQASQQKLKEMLQKSGSGLGQFTGLPKT